MSKANRSKLSSQIDDLFRLKWEIYEAMGYVQDWTILPIEDHRQFFWTLDGPDDEAMEVTFSESAEEQRAEAVYGNSVLRGRFVPTPIRRAHGFVIIAMDTHTDGNKCVGIFDEKKELKDA